MTFLTIIYVLIFIIFTLITIAIMQIKLAGMNVKDFWSFIEANQMLDKLYAYSKRLDQCEKMTAQEQIVFLQEAEEIFKAFDKVPNLLWEEDYDKYTEVLNKYKDIRMLRWASN